jgi:hypothetical protein
MDWLRSEDLKEEKNVTASVVIIAVEVVLLSGAKTPPYNSSIEGSTCADTHIDGDRRPAWT